ncbi:MAG: hypothetical protein MJY55_03080 [Bacteroidales bacterium]|nr:hypothetical protein [Bacteroidales bacterium]
MRHITLKSIIAGALLLCTGWNAWGEEFDKMQLSVRVGLGGSPVAAQNYYKAKNSYNEYPLSTYYGDYYGPAYTSGVVNVGVDLRILKWLGLGIDINVTPIWHDKYHKDDSRIGRETGVALTILPMAKFYYFRRPIIMLYGRAGMGFGKYFNYPSLTYSYRDNSGARHFVDESYKFEVQCVPFGFELGKKVFWFAELGVGTVYIGGQTGIGYRF